MLCQRLYLIIVFGLFDLSDCDKGHPPKGFKPQPTIGKGLAGLAG
jgi:hypothetical protein